MEQLCSRLCNYFYGAILHYGGIQGLFCGKASREFNFYSESKGKHLEDGHTLIPKAETENKICPKHCIVYRSLTAPYGI